MVMKRSRRGAERMAGLVIMGRHGQMLVVLVVLVDVQSLSTLKVMGTPMRSSAAVLESARLSVDLLESYNEKNDVMLWIQLSQVRFAFIFLFVWIGGMS